MPILPLHVCSFLPAPAGKVHWVRSYCQGQLGLSSTEELTSNEIKLYMRSKTLYLVTEVIINTKKLMSGRQQLSFQFKIIMSGGGFCFFYKKRSTVRGGL